MAAVRAAIVATVVALGVALFAWQLGGSAGAVTTPDAPGHHVASISL